MGCKLHARITCLKHRNGLTSSQRTDRALLDYVSLIQLNVSLTQVLLSACFSQRAKLERETKVLQFRKKA